MKTRLDSDVKKAFSSRMRTLMEQHLKLTLTELAKRLDYKGPSGLQPAVEGRGFIGADRLPRLAQLTDELGHHPNLNWLITGVGPPMLPPPSPSPAPIQVTPVATLPANAEVTLRIVADAIEQSRSR